MTAGDSSAPAPVAHTRLLRADSRRTRDAILDGGFRVLGERPDASLEEIAQATGVNRSTVHRHFPRREDLIQALEQTAIRQIDEVHAECRAEGGPASEQLERMLRRLVLLGERLRFFLERWAELRLDAFASGESWRDLVAAARREGSVRADLSTKWITVFVGATLLAAIKLAGEGFVTSEEAATLVVESVMTGLSPARGGP